MYSKDPKRGRFSGPNGGNYGSYDRGSGNAEQGYGNQGYGGNSGGSTGYGGGGGNVGQQQQQQQGGGGRSGFNAGYAGDNTGFGSPNSTNYGNNNSNSGNAPFGSNFGGGNFGGNINGASKANTSAEFNGATGNFGGSGGSTTVAKPSKVVQVRALPDQVMEADLIDACAQFGVVNYVSLTGRGTALLEFETQRSAEECISYNSSTDIFVMNKSAFFTFAPMESIPRRGLESDRPSKCLVMQVQNPRYPISTDVIATICKPIAPPMRLRICRLSGIYVFGEFQDAETARTLKQRLNGCDIYSGCCTLKIEYAKMSRVSVIRNDQEQWDYVGPPGQTASDRPSLLSEPPAYSGAIGNEMQGQGGNELGYDDYGRPVFEDSENANMATTGNAITPMGANGNMGNNMSAMQGGNMPSNNMGGGNMNNQMMGGNGNGNGSMGNNMGNANYYDNSYDNYGGNMNSGNMGMGGSNMAMGMSGSNMGMGMGMGGGNMGMGMGGGNMGMGMGNDMIMGGDGDGTGIGLENAVVMFYGLDEEKMNADKLFNICCLYGNVMKIKFLRSKAGSAMVQMGDPTAANRLCQFLNRMEIFGNPIQVSASKKPWLEPLRAGKEADPLKDGTPSYVDFEFSRSNRFLTPETAVRNRISGPGEKLYMYNAPPDLDDKKLRDLLKELGAPDPAEIKILDKRENSRSCAGTIMFSNASDAAEALVVTNHHSMDSEASRTPYLVKFCFTAGGSGGSGMNSSGGGRGGGGFRGSSRASRGRGGGGYGDGGDQGSKINGPQFAVEDRLKSFRGRGGARGGGRGDFRGRGRGDSRGRGSGGFRGGRGNYHE